MINISEYLLSNKNNKIKKPERPKEKCKLQDVINWLNNFGVENWDESHKYPDKMNVGDIAWSIGVASYNSYVYFANMYKEQESRYVKIGDNGKSYIDTGRGPMFETTFEKALDFIEASIENPTEYIDRKDI